MPPQLRWIEKNGEKVLQYFHEDFSGMRGHEHRSFWRDVPTHKPRETVVQPIEQPQEVQSASEEEALGPTIRRVACGSVVRFQDDDNEYLLPAWPKEWVGLFPAEKWWVVDNDDGSLAMKSLDETCTIVKEAKGKPESSEE